MSDQRGIGLETESDYDTSWLKGFLTRPGCLLWLLALLLLFGVLVTIAFFVVDSDPPAPNTAPAVSATATPPAASCEDATAAFRASGSSDAIQRVCWEPTGQLRAEAGLPADIEPGSAPMKAVCMALSDFVTGSGRDWKGFTVYSTHPFTPGQAMLTSSEPRQCSRPPRS